MTWLEGLIAILPLLALVGLGAYRMYLDSKEDKE